MAVAHEVVEALPKIIRLWEFLQRCWHGPLVAIAFAKNVEVRAGDLLVIGIAMRRATKVEPGKDEHLSRARLVGGFEEIDPPSGDIEEELFRAIVRDERDDEAAAAHGEEVNGFVLPLLGSCKERVGFGLSEFTISHVG